MDDRFMAKVAVENGWITPEILELCQQEKAKHPEWTLELIFTKRGYLTSAQRKLTRQLYETASQQHTLQMGEVEMVQVHPVEKKSNQLKYFGDFQIVKEVGRGGMGVVYQAIKNGETKPVALKVLLDEVRGQEEFFLRFQREIRLCSQLRHPNIVGIHEFGEIEGRAYFSMDFVQGRSLSDMLKKQKKLAQREALEMTEKIARAIHEAHQKGIVHRDIKPENILVDEQNEPFIMDFGIAKSRQAGEAKLTRTGTIMGTPSYMSPEQACGKIHQINHKSDIYSIGATLYHLLTGVPPFDAKEPIITVAQVIKKDPIPLRERNPEIAREVEILVLKAMAKNPELRYPSAESLAEDIHGYLHEGTISAKAEGWISRCSRWMSNNTPWVVSVGIALVTILLTLWIVLSSR